MADADARGALEDEREALQRQLKELGADGGISFDENFADSGQVAAEQGENRALVNQLEETLTEVERALTKLDEGAFGYAKPVPVNPRKLRNPRQHSLYVSLAGPATNLTLAAVSIVVLRVGYRNVVRLAAELQAPELLSGVARFLFWLALVNVILAVFNLLPIPPLDGSALIERVLPRSWWPAWLKWRQWGFGVLLLLIFVVPGSLSRVFDPAIDFFLR